MTVYLTLSINYINFSNSLICYNLKSHGLDKGIPHNVLPMKQLVLSNKWVRNQYSIDVIDPEEPSLCSR